MTSNLIDDHAMPANPPPGGHAPPTAGTADRNAGPNGADLGREPADEDDASAPAADRPGDEGKTMGTGGGREQDA